MGYPSSHLPVSVWPGGSSKDIITLTVKAGKFNALWREPGLMIFISLEQQQETTTQLNIRSDRWCCL